MKSPRDSAPTGIAESPDDVDKARIIDDRRGAAKHKAWALALLLAVCSVGFFCGLGRLPLVGPDEPRYAEVAREMFASGDYVSTKLCGCLWFEKPALVYWMAAASYHVFGVDEFAARIPSAFVAFLTAVVIYLTLSRLVSSRQALVSSVVLATSGIFIAYARAVTTDMALTASMSLALLSGFLAIRAGGRAGTWLWALSFAAMGLAMLAKGLVGLLLVITILGLYVAATRQLRAVRIRDVAIGSGVFLMTAGTWYAPVILRHGWDFVGEFFIRHHFERYVSDDFGHPQPFYFFFLVALAGVVPWSFFLIPAAARLRAVVRQDPLLLFAWLWAVVPVAFYSLSRSKLPGYILPAFPALAIIIGSEVERFLSGASYSLSRFSSWLTALLLVAMGVGLITYASLGRASSAGGAALLAIPLVLGLTSSLLLFRRKKPAFVAGAAATVLSAIIGAVVVLLPALGENISLKRLSLESAAALRPGEKITFFLRKEFAPVFYAEGRVVCGVEGAGVLNSLSQDVLARALAENGPSLIVITSLQWEDDLVGDGRFLTEFIGGQGSALAYRVKLSKVMNNPE